MIGTGQVQRIGRRTLLEAGGIEDAARRIIESLLEYQREHPLRWGLLKSELKSRLGRQVHPELVESWIKNRIEAGDLHIREDRLRHGEAQVDLSPAHEAIRKSILNLLEERGYSGPSTKELLEAVGPSSGAEELLAHLIREDTVLRIPPDLLLPARRVAEMRKLLVDYFSRNDSMGVAPLKEMLSVSRKQAVPLLEWCDRNRWTERRGDVRVEGPRLREEAS